MQINWGQGETTSAAFVVHGLGSGTFTATHRYVDDALTGTPADIYVITATVTDDDGGVSPSATVEITVQNVAPTAIFANNGPITYGQTATVIFSDPHDDSVVDTAAGFHYAYSLIPDFTGITYDTGTSTSATRDFTGLNAGNYTVYARIMDKDGGYTDYSQQIVVAQADADVSIIPYSGVYDGLTHNLTGTVTGVAGDLAAAGSSLTFGNGYTTAGNHTGTGVLKVVSTIWMKVAVRRSRSRAAIRRRALSSVGRPAVFVVRLCPGR